MLKMTNVCKIFNEGTVNERNAITNMNLNIKKGDFVTIIGSNGAGKSTLFNLIGGQILADKGEIVLDNNNITYKKEHKRAKEIGRLFQDPLKGTAPNMTIEENLALAYMRTTGKKFGFGISKENRDFFQTQLEQLQMGLENRMKTKVGLLSGGQRQAVTLMMSTLVTPKLLLLDEHTAALDPETAEKVLLITRNIVKQNNVTTMMITHNIDSALSLGNRTIMMHDGKIVTDIEGVVRENMTKQKLLDMFKEASQTTLATDRIILS
ncbi:MAG: ABC transporter ATP-binding protein [Cellulosilyticaceae bacterium]